MPDWLLAPIDAARVHDVPELVAWHARVMTLAWCILVPSGILAARFLKLWPGQKWPEKLDHPGWWHLHRSLQYCAGALTLIGIILIVSRPGAFSARSFHVFMGWSVISLLLLQFVSAWSRGSKGGPTAPARDGSWHGDHYDMTPRRVIFEYLHKFGGYIAVIVAAAAIVSGLWQANAPRWMWIIIGVWWIFCLVAFAFLQRRGFTFDTYQAHWGSDPVHPGNRRAPIGFGIRRFVSTRFDGKRHESL